MKAGFPLNDATVLQVKISDVMVTSVNANSEVTTYRQDDATYATLMIADPLVHADVNADGQLSEADLVLLIQLLLAQ